MKGLLKIGIVGCGAIGSSLAEAITYKFRGEAEVVCIYDIDIAKAQALAKRIPLKKATVAKDLDELITRAKLVIECASGASAWDITRKAVTKGKDIMVMSVGGISKHMTLLRGLASRHDATVYVPSGALSGIDALKAAGYSSINKVILTTRKHPSAFEGIEYLKKKGIDLKKIRKEKVLFDGKAKEAVLHFPQNVNVAAILSIAGIGDRKTRVKIVASASVRRNVHEVCIESKAGRVNTRTENVIHPLNPKTSFLAVLAAIAMLKRIVQPIKIGT